MAEPVIGYAGAKWRFYPYLQNYFPKDMKVFIEPFFGGGSVGMSVADDVQFGKLERIIVGDLNTELCEMWKGIKHNADDVSELVLKWWGDWCPTHIQSTLVLKDRDSQESQEEQKQILLEVRAFYNWAKSVDTKTLNRVERAARYFLMSKITFSALNDSGSLSQSRVLKFRAKDSIKTIPDAERVLEKIEIYNQPYEDTLRMATKESFVFLDPPYWQQEASKLYGNRGELHKGFAHEHLGGMVLDLPCKWFITYDDSMMVRRFYQEKRGVSLMPFIVPSGYTVATTNKEDSLAGEELFIANYALEAEKEEVFDF